MKKPSNRKRVAAQAVFVALALAAACAAHGQTKKKPQPPPDDWKGTNFVTALPASVSAAGEPFDPSVLGAMTPQGAVCSEELNAAIYRQDVLHAFESKAHFDNCAFDDAAAYVDTLVGEARTRIARIGPTNTGEVPPELRAAMLAFGQALHAIQDFYAHSDYVEWIQQRSPAPGDEAAIPLVEFWTPPGRERLRDLARNGLVSGRVWWSVPGYCAPDAPTHADLAKDNAGTKAGARPSLFTHKLTGQRISNHTVAFNLASRATREFLRWAGSKSPEIEKYCGPTVRYIVPQDRREAD
jgi:hypothetical protein